MIMSSTCRRVRPVMGYLLSGKDRISSLVYLISTGSMIIFSLFALQFLFIHFPSCESGSSGEGSIFILCLQNGHLSWNIFLMASSFTTPVVCFQIRGLFAGYSRVA